MYCNLHTFLFLFGLDLHSIKDQSEAGRVERIAAGVWPLRFLRTTPGRQDCPRCSTSPSEAKMRSLCTWSVHGEFLYNNKPGPRRRSGQLL